MTQRRRSLAWTLLLGMLVLGLQPARASGQGSLAGVYQCVGQNDDGSTYRGTVRITKRGETYLLEWRIGSATHAGVGIVEGNLLSSSWAVKGQPISGVVVYRIERGGFRLLGRWTQYPGNGKTLKETLTLIR